MAASLPRSQSTQRTSRPSERITPTQRRNTSKFSRSRDRGKRYSYPSTPCNCNIDFGGQVSKKYRHNYRNHTHKYTYFVCRECDCYFFNLQEFAGHIDVRHKAEVASGKCPSGRQMAADNIDLSIYCSMYLTAYLQMPFCKTCGYTNPYLFQNHIGCWCPSRRPSAGGALDAMDKYLIEVPKAPRWTMRPTSHIPNSWVCRAAGMSFVDPSSEDPLPPSVQSERSQTDFSAVRASTD